MCFKKKKKLKPKTNEEKSQEKQKLGKSSKTTT